jgi:hypothetical protein
MPEHEGQFVLAEDVHDRIEGGADASAGQEGRDELPELGSWQVTTSLRSTPRRDRPTATRFAMTPSSLKVRSRRAPLATWMEVSARLSGHLSRQASK